MGKGDNNIEGRLDIRLRLSDGVVDTVDIQSSRPLLTPRIFTGKSVEYLLSTLPLLYSVCGTAQAHAAVTACEQALGIEEEDARSEFRERLVWLETTKEHLWRVLLDWPALMNLPPAPGGVGEIMQLIKRYRHDCFPNERPFFLGVMPSADAGQSTDTLVGELEDLLIRQVLGMPVFEWLSMDSCTDLLHWAGQSDSSAAAMLQYVQAKGWQALGAGSIDALPYLQQSFLQRQMDRLEADQFISAPQIANCCYETSPFVRVQDHPLVKAVAAEFGSGLFTRLVARLVELADIPNHLRSTDVVAGIQESDHLPEGVGISQIEAARGRLIHRVVLENNVISRYQILAPTEWNFHPAGVLTESLKGLKFESVELLKQQAALLINAIDPCVGYELQVE